MPLYTTTRPPGTFGKHASKGTALVRVAFMIGLVFVCFIFYYSSMQAVSSTKSSSRSAFVASAMSMKNTMPRSNIRIFCYGDSLTAGTSPPYDELYPYAVHLERSINNFLTQKFNQLKDNEQQSAPKVTARWIGLPGWTAKTMLQFADDSKFGLRAAVKKVQNPSLSLVIILAGTNDLGMEAAGLLSDDGGEHHQGSDRISSDVIALHKLVQDEGKNSTILTLAVSIPTSKWQETMSLRAQAMAADANSKIQAWCNATENAHFITHPIESWSTDDTRWAPDGLHFSPQGYEEFGVSLSPIVCQLLFPEISNDEFY